MEKIFHLDFCLEIASLENYEDQNGHIARSNAIIIPDEQAIKPSAPDLLQEILRNTKGVMPVLVFDHAASKLSDAIAKCCEKRIAAAGGLVLNVAENNLGLFIFRKGRWDLPKGKVEKGEAFEQAAKREISEETGAQNLILDKFLTKTNHVYKMNGKTVFKETYWYLLHSEDFLPKPQVEEDITEIKWYDIKNLSTSFDTYALIWEVISCAIPHVN